MDVLNYSNRLSDHKQNYWDMAKELRDNYEKDLQNIERTHEYKQQKNKENISAIKDRYDKDMKRNMADVNDRTQKAIRKKNHELKMRLGDEQKTFDSERQRIQKKFDNRLRELASSYDKAKQTKDLQHEHELHNTKRRFNNRIVSNRDEYEGQIKDMSDSAYKNLKKYQEDHLAEKREMIQGHTDEKHKLMAGEVSVQNNIKGKFQNQVDQLRKNHDNEVGMLKNHHAGLQEAATEKHQLEKDDMESNFENITNRVQRRNVKEQQKLSKQNSELAKNLNERFQKDVKVIQRKANALAHNGDLTNQQHQEVMQERFDSRLQQLKDSMEAQTNQHQFDKNNIQDNFKDLVQQESDKRHKDMDRYAKETNKFNEEMRDKFRKEKGEMRENADRRLRTVMKDHEISAYRDRTNAKKALENQRNMFSDTLKSMSEKNIETVDSIQKEFAKEKTAFLEKAKRDLHHLHADLRDEQRNKLDSLISAYDKRLEMAQNNLTRTKDLYEERMEALERKTSKEIAQQNISATERRKEDVRDFKRTLNNQEKKSHKEFLALKGEFDKKINRIKHHNDIHVTKLTQRYEDMLAQTKRDYEREIRRREALNRSEYLQLAKSEELAKDAIRNQYEMKLEKTRLTNMMQQEKIARRVVEDNKSSIS